MVKIRVEEGDKVEVEGKDRYLYAEYLEPEGDNRVEVPKVRERLRVIPLEGKSIYEGVHPDWYDVLQNAGDQKRSQNEEKIGDVLEELLQVVEESRPEADQGKPTPTKQARLSLR